MSGSAPRCHSSFGFYVPSKIYIAIFKSASIFSLE